MGEKKLNAVKLKYAQTNMGGYSLYHCGTWQQQPPKPSLSLSICYTTVMSCWANDSRINLFSPLISLNNLVLPSKLQPIPLTPHWKREHCISFFSNLSALTQQTTLHKLLHTYYNYCIQASYTLCWENKWLSLYVTQVLKREEILDVVVHWMMLSGNLKLFGMDRNAGVHKFFKTLGATSKF